MTENRVFHENSDAVQAHLGIIQSVIERMASNSASCKAWCITLVSAVLVIVADKGKSEYALIAVIPNLLFLVLDAYYLALERGFRRTYNAFIGKLHREGVSAGDLYAVSPTGTVAKMFFSALRSFSIWPFYLTLLAMIWLVKRLVIGASPVHSP